MLPAYHAHIVNNLTFSRQHGVDLCPYICPHGAILLEFGLVRFYNILSISPIKHCEAT